MPESEGVGEQSEGISSVSWSLPWSRKAKPMTVATEAVLVVQFRPGSSTECWKRMKSMKQVFWKLRSQLRGMMMPAKHNTSSFAYDPKSYSQNFDDGFFHDHFMPSSSPRPGFLNG